MLQYSYLENPTDRGAWQEIVHGVTKSQTQLKRLSMHTLHQSNEMFYKPPWTCLTYNRHTTSFSSCCFYSFASKYRFLAEHFLSQCHWPGPHLSVESHTCPDPYNFLKNIFLPKQAPSLLSILRTTTMVLSRYQHNFVMTHGLQNRFSSVQFSSVAQSCRTLCNPMDCSMPGLPVHHQLPEFTQTHVHCRWCHPAISSSVVPFSSCPQSLPASGSFQMSQLFAWGGQSTGVSASTSVLPMNTQDWSLLGWTG